MSAASFKEQGNQFLQAKQYDEAIAAYTEAINLDPKDHVFFSNRSAAYLSKGDASSALADGQRCIELKGDWAKGYTRKGAALHALRRYEDAAAAYKAGLAIAPTDAGLQGGLKEVEKIMESSQAPPGGGLFGPQMIAKLAGHPKFGPKLGDPAFMRKLQMAQSNPQLLMSDPEMMEVLQVILGGMGGAEGEEGAEEPFRPSPSASSSQPQQQQQQSSKKAPEPEPELTEEERAAKQVRDKSTAAKDRGNALYKSKQFADALTAYDEALEADPTNFMVMNNKAAVYIEMGECDTAIEVCNLIFEKARAAGVKVSYEDKAKVYQRIAAAHLKKDDVPAAIKAYGSAQMECHDKAIERKIKNLELELKKSEKLKYINPELGLAAKERGNTCFRDGDFPGAIREFEEATKRDPTNAAYHNNLAAAYLKMGVFNDAKKEVERSLELDKTYVKAWAKKGDIEFFMKEYHKSMESYKTGLVLEPDNSLCKQGLQKTMMKINEGGADKERAAHAMADPEIQAILSDPTIRQVLNDFQDNPKFAQAAMANDKDIRAKIEKLIAAGVLQVK
jgi:stress-induced-phosphoprotein 1